MSAPTLSNPRHYYAVCSVTDPVAVRRHTLMRDEHELWAAVLPADIDSFDEDSTATLTARLYRSTGYAEGYIIDAIHAYATLNALPRLRALQDELFHLDLYRLRIISDALLKADHEDPEMMAAIDEALTDYLTPKRANQILPNKHALRRKINQILKLLDTSIATDDQEHTEDTAVAQSYDMYNQPEEDSAQLNVSLDAATATAVDVRVRAHAETKDITLAEALVDLILGAEGTKVVLNLYQASDDPAAPAYLPGAGYLSPCGTQFLLDRSSHTRDIDSYAQVKGKGYQTPETIAAYVEGRDGVCRWPGCQRPATECQKDHRIDYDKGGPTTANNLISLCQHHHNEKTAGRAFYLLDPYTDVVYWLFTDGSWTCDDPQGPLAGASRRWQRTVGQRLTARRTRSRQEAQLRKRQQDETAAERQRAEEGDDQPPF